MSDKYPKTGRFPSLPERLEVTGNSPKPGRGLRRASERTFGRELRASAAPRLRPANACSIETVNYQRENQKKQSE